MMNKRIPIKLVKQNILQSRFHLHALLMHPHDRLFFSFFFFSLFFSIFNIVIEYLLIRNHYEFECGYNMAFCSVFWGHLNVSLVSIDCTTLSLLCLMFTVHIRYVFIVIRSVACIYVSFYSLFSSLFFYIYLFCVFFFFFFFCCSSSKTFHSFP